ncbi:MAG: replication-relaxation family protein [Kineosporiaceae bacterium]|nr:replication-relaxation family protein [Kineosporiaceae bacterium]MBK8077589.1 replication-relaxation family protein [Kineosporiaceae bacterium]
MTTSITRRRLARVRLELTNRDWQVIHTLAKVRLATSTHLEDLHCTDITRRRAQDVLRSLAERRLVTRLPRVIGGVRAGSRGHVYALDVAGQRVVDQASGRRPRPPRAVGPAYVDHALALTQTYVDIVQAERRGELGIREYEGEPMCWRSFFGVGGVRATLRPDAYTVLRVDGYEDHWFLEIDRSTESAAVLGRKMEQYLGYMRSGKEQAQHGIYPKVLWLVPDTTRARVVSKVIERQPLTLKSVFLVALQSEAVARLKQGAA